MTTQGYWTEYHYKRTVAFCDSCNMKLSHERKHMAQWLIEQHIREVHGNQLTLTYPGIAAGEIPF